MKYLIMVLLLVGCTEKSRADWMRVDTPTYTSITLPSGLECIQGRFGAGMAVSCNWEKYNNK